MKGLISAIQFLTIIPMGRDHVFDPKGMIPFFPVVGLILGALLSIFDYGVSGLWPAPVAAVLDVGLLILLTGALHVDGLGDTADGLYGNRPREKALAIMKDSRIGAMGLVAVVMGLAIKWGGIQCLGDHRTLLLILIPAYARAGMLFGVKFLEYGRPEGGTAHDFFTNSLGPVNFIGLLLPIGLSCLLGLRGVWLNGWFILATGGILLFYKKRIGCITGDMLGALTETSEALLFLLASAGGMP